MSLRICAEPGCGKSFIPVTGQQKFCKDHSWSRNKGRIAEPSKAICGNPECRKEFLAVFNRKNCCAACSRRAKAISARKNHPGAAPRLISLEDSQTFLWSEQKRIQSSRLARYEELRRRYHPEYVGGTR